MKKITFILIIFFLSTVFVTAQSRKQKKRITYLENKLENTKKKDLVTRIEIYEELSEIHLDFAPFKSIEYLKNAKKILKKANVSIELEANIYNNFGAAYYYLQDFTNSIKFYKKELAILKKSTNTKEICEAEYNIATIFLQKNKKKAINHFENSLELAKQINNKDLQMLNYQAIYSIYEGKGIIHSDSRALENFKLYIALRDGQIDYESRRKVSILRGKYKVERTKREETEEKLQETDSTLNVVVVEKEELKEDTLVKAIAISELEWQKELNEQKLEWKDKETQYQEALNTQKMLLLGAVSLIGIFLLIAALWLFGLYKKIQRNRKKVFEQKEEIVSQRDEITFQNTQITDSLNYAKKIQDSILISEKEIKQHLPKMFVYNRPRDIVSGDFYWFSKVQNKIVVAAIDCTGHGVPGAFISMIGNTLLNEIVNEREIIIPDKILTLLHFGVLTALQQNKEGSSAEDGMDMSLCTIDKKQKRFQFSGAKNNLYVVQGDKLKILKANYHSIGGKPLREDTNLEFTSFDFMYDDKTSIYMLSDGYLDQFGGEEDKKFNTVRFKNMLLRNRHLPMIAQKGVFKDTMNKWIGTKDQIDDMLVLGIKLD